MYATPDQLAHLRGIYDGFDEQETVRATDRLVEATGVIDDELGQSLLASTDTVTLDGTGTDQLILPRHPVTAVVSVVEVALDGTETALVYGTDYTWSEAGILVRLGGRWPCHQRSVVVVFTAGYALDDPQLMTVRSICLRLASAGWDNPSGANTEDNGDHQIRWNTPGMQLTTGEIRRLGKWAR